MIAHAFVVRLHVLFPQLPRHFSAPRGVLGGRAADVHHPHAPPATRVRENTGNSPQGLCWSGVSTARSLVLQLRRKIRLPRKSACPMRWPPSRHQLSAIRRKSFIFYKPLCYAFSHRLKSTNGQALHQPSPRLVHRMRPYASHAALSAISSATHRKPPSVATHFSPPSSSTGDLALHFSILQRFSSCGSTPANRNANSQCVHVPSPSPKDVVQRGFTCAF